MPKPELNKLGEKESICGQFHGKVVGCTVVPQ